MFDSVFIGKHLQLFRVTACKDKDTFQNNGAWSYCYTISVQKVF